VTRSFSSSLSSPTPSSSPTPPASPSPPLTSFSPSTPVNNLSSALGNYLEFCDTPLTSDLLTEDTPGRRAERLQILRVVGSWSSYSSLTSCLKAAVEVLVTTKTVANGRAAGFSGPMTCKLIHCCPWCSAKSRNERATHLDRLTTGWLNAGGSISFGVFTLASEPGELVSATTKAVQACYSAMWRGAWFERFKHRYGYVGRIDAFEWTIRLDGSGHPHLQPLFMFDRALTAVEADHLVRDLRRRWLHVTDANGRHADLIAGYRGEMIGLVNGKCQAIAAYMVKGSESWTLGAEMCRGDAKQSRSDTTFAPFDLARYALATGDMAARFAWREFEKASRGVKSLRYTRGLRALMEVAAHTGRIGPHAELLTADDEDQGDEPELPTNEQEEADDVIEDGHKGACKIAARTWNWCRRHGYIDGLLRTVEQVPDDGDVVAAVRQYLYDLGADDDLIEGVYPPP
jgi:hypothetical protein